MTRTTQMGAQLSLLLLLLCVIVATPLRASADDSGQTVTDSELAISHDTHGDGATLQLHQRCDQRRAQQMLT